MRSMDTYAQTYSQQHKNRQKLTHTHRDTWKYLVTEKTGMHTVRWTECMQSDTHREKTNSTDYKHRPFLPKLMHTNLKEDMCTRKMKRPIPMDVYGNINKLKITRPRKATHRDTQSEK